MNSQTPYRIEPAGNSTRIAHLLNVTMLIVMFMLAVLGYESLPQKIPVHFDARGVADGWAEKSWGAWLAFPLTGLGMTVIFYACSQIINLAKKKPGWLSMPLKKQFLALPPQTQEPIWKQIRSMMFWLAVPINGLFLYLIYGTQAVATGRYKVLPIWPTILAVFLEIGMVLVLTIALYRSIQNAVKEHSQSSANL